MTRIEADAGFVEYKIAAEHRESWQQIVALLTSLADLAAFAFELSREMKMGYKAPVLPVELKMMQEDTEQSLPLMPPVTSFLPDMPVEMERMEGGTEQSLPLMPPLSFLADTAMFTAEADC
jgi:hypothetical protein